MESLYTWIIYSFLMVKLGRLELSGNLILAPMAMYSDVALRKICYN